MNQNKHESLLEIRPASRPLPPGETTYGSRKKRILVIDDEPSITQLLKLNLEQTNQYLVRTENSPDRAVAVAEQFLPELILLDIMMPGMDGGDLANLLQGSAKLRNVPIVFLTAVMTKGEVREHRGEIGGFEFLAKPVDLAEVLACLHKHLALK